MNTHVSKTLLMDVPTAIDGFKNIISSLNNENSLHFLNWVKENINGEVFFCMQITKSDKTVFSESVICTKRYSIHDSCGLQCYCWFPKYKRHILIISWRENWVWSFHQTNLFSTSWPCVPGDAWATGLVKCVCHGWL